MNIIKNITGLILSIALLIISQPASGQSDIDTSWNGAIDIMGTELGIIVKFRTDAGKLSASIDIPEQGAKDIELEKVSFSNPKIHFELASPGGTAVFDGLYYGDSIGGTFMQAGLAGRFQLTRGENLKIPEPENTDDLPFYNEEITFNNDGNTFAGTLTLPKGEGKYPAIVLITGSGAQNRNEEIYGFKIFKIIAEYLAARDIAVLRYDDRGVGGSKGKTVNESTTDDFAGDVAAAVEFLKTREEVNHGKIGLMGHSEGGIVAPLAFGKTEGIRFMILMAGTGVKGIDIIKEQSRLIMKAENATDEEIEGYIMIMDKIYETLQKEGNIKELESQLEKNVEDSFEKMTKEEKAAIKDKDAYIKETVQSTIAQFSTNWMKFFLNYDPVPALQKVTCPVLVLFGGKDLQVPPAQNRKYIEDALRSGGNNDFEVVVFPGANHLFQEAGTGSPNEYPQLPKEFIPGFLEKINEWLDQKVKP